MEFLINLAHSHQRHCSSSFSFHPGLTLGEPSILSLGDVTSLLSYQHCSATVCPSVPSGETGHSSPDDARGIRNQNGGEEGFKCRKRNIQKQTSPELQKYSILYQEAEVFTHYPTQQEHFHSQKGIKSCCGRASGVGNTASKA